MRIAIDATPAARQGAGVGRYTRELLRALVQQPTPNQYLLAVAGSDDDARGVWSDLPPGAWRETRLIPASERVMTAAWQRLRIPLTVERLVGEFDLFHGTDFVLPPTDAATVVTIHDLSFIIAPEYSDPRLVRYLNAAVPRAIEKADAVIGVSASVAAEIGEHFPNSRERLFAIPNGVNGNVGEQTRRASDVPIVLTVGTIEPRKNHRTLLDAMDSVWQVYPDARLEIIGRTGWLADDIVKRIRIAERTGQVRWIADADDGMLKSAYANATVFAYPARYEGFGLPVLEAMARGVPVVASDAAALREVSAGAARHVQAGDAEELGNSIVGLLDSPEERERLAREGLARSRAFSWRQTAERTLRAYDFAFDRRYAS